MQMSLQNDNFDLCKKAKKAKRRSLHLRMETKTVFQNYRKHEENTIRAFIEKRADFTQYLKYSIYGRAVFLLGRWSVARQITCRCSTLHATCIAGRI